jgi:hypothetical protein
MAAGNSVAKGQRFLAKAAQSAKAYSILVEHAFGGGRDPSPPLTFLQSLSPFPLQQ